MRNLLFLLTALALGGAASSTLEAQGPRLGLAAGANIPTSTLEETHDVGYHGAISLNMRSATSPFGFRPEGAWYQFGGEGTIGNLRSLALTGNVTIDMPGQGVRPYLIGGAGYYNTKVEDVDADNSLGLNAGVGLRFGMSGRTSAFLEARFHHVIDGIQRGGEDRNAQFVPISFGLIF